LLRFAHFACIGYGSIGSRSLTEFTLSIVDGFGMTER